ncbi:hypothetical protein CJU90_6388 [Yarrowia sp. C11]|nr:hypothetical protein CJU90_6388 [Yarrowia sp. C11]
MRHLTVEVLSSDPQSFNIDVSPNICVGELCDIIAFHFNELFLFSKLGQIASITCRGRDLPWSMQVAGLNQIDTIEVHPKQMWGTKEARRSPVEQKAKAVVIAYDQPRIPEPEFTSNASTCPDLVRDSTSPSLLEKVKSLEVKSDDSSDQPEDESLAQKITKLNRVKVHRVFSLGSPILFIRLGSSGDVSNFEEIPLGLYLDPAFDAKERREIQRKRRHI